VTPASGLISGLASSDDLKGRVVDFMERAEELLSHPMAGYTAPFTLNVTASQSTGEILSYELDHRLLDKEVLVYFATIARPMLFTESEPIYIPKLIAAVGHEHPALIPMCGAMSKLSKDEWRNRVFIGLKTSTTPVNEPTEGWTLTNVRTAPSGTAFPDDEMSELPMIEDYEFTKLYLNGFVWHNDSDKILGYRQASQLMQLHYRKCTEIRVFGGLQLVIKPIHQFFLHARAAGEDLE
jgi:hypothetical protein